jgi:RHS repeat-associated protein
VLGVPDDQDRLTSYGGTSYTWRPAGALESRTDASGTSWFDYDALGSLRAVLLPSGARIDYVVDGQGRRIGKKVNGILTEGFLYEGKLRPVAWLDGAGQVKARFVYGTRINVPEYMVTTGGTYRILTDHLGSPRLVVDSTTGAIAQRVDYDEWGVVLSDSNPGFQPFGFAGGIYDRDTGLVRFGARDYEPATGRWTNKDPILFEGGDPNLYVYAANDPVNFIDETGLSVGSAVGNFFLGVAEGVAGTIIVAGLVASGPVGVVLAVALVGYGSYAATTNLYAAALGEDPYTGRAINAEDRIDIAARGVGQLAGSCAGGSGYAAGREFQVPWLLGRSPGPAGKPGRIAPWGNRTGNEWGEFPHYHRAVENPAQPGTSLPGQNLKPHRPWEGGW